MDDAEMEFLRDLKKDLHRDMSAVKASIDKVEHTLGQQLRDHTNQDHENFQELRGAIASARAEASSAKVDAARSEGAIEVATGKFHVPPPGAVARRPSGWFESGLAKAAKQVLPYVAMALTIELVHRCGLPTPPLAEAAPKVEHAAPPLPLPPRP